ncbi:MAG: M28 family metallopeptidase [Thermoplasmata archaeon]
MSKDSATRPRAPSALAVIALSLSALLVLGPWSVGTAHSAPPDEELVASVDLDRIRGTIETLEAFGSREFHLESSRQAAQYLYDALEEVGVPAELQYFTVGDTTVSNVIGTVQGSDEGAGVYLFGAHYDSENRDVYDLSTAENLTAPGADDDASGVAAVLEMARIVAGAGFPGTVKFVMFGAEEMGYDNSGGCKGSEYFAANESAQGHEYSGTAVLDMVGYRAGAENKASIVVNGDDQPLTGSTRDAVGVFGIDLDIDLFLNPDLVYSDHSSFWAEGIPSMLVIEELDDRCFPVNPMYHTSYDIAETLSLDQVVAVTEALLGGLLLLEEGGDDGGWALVFGTALMAVVIVSIALFIYVRRKRGRVGDGT